MVCWPRNINANQCYSDISLTLCIRESTRQNLYLSPILFEIFLQELPLGGVGVADSFSIQ